MLSYDMSERGTLSLYEYLYRRIREDIVSGALAPGDRLPSRRPFAEHLGVSLVTIDGAYAQLVAEGYVVARPRRGYYVADLGATRPAADDATGDAQAPSPTPSRAPGIGAGRGERDRAPLADFTRPSLRAGSSAAALWSRALRQALAREPEGELFSSPPAQGCPRLRRAIAGYLHGQRGMDVGPESIVVGAGSQMLHGTIALMMARAGGEPAADAPVVAMEDPGWPALRAVYASRGMRVSPVPMDAEGISVDGVRASGARLVHVMPSHQFPTGRVTTIARRYELLGWAASTGGWIVEDDYDWEFRLAGRPIPSLAGIDATGCVTYVSTFSKSLSSALRIAFMVLPPRLLEVWRGEPGLAAATVSTIDQIALARLLESGDYERHVARYRTQSREVRDALVRALGATALGARMSVEEADSGLHFVLAVETDATEEQVAERAADLGVRLAPLSRYAADPRSLPEDGRARFVMQYDGLDASRVERVADVIVQSALGGEG